MAKTEYWHIDRSTKIWIAFHHEGLKIALPKFEVDLINSKQEFAQVWCQEIAKQHQNHTIHSKWRLPVGFRM